MGPEAARLRVAADTLVPQYLDVAHQGQPKPSLRELGPGSHHPGHASGARRAPACTVTAIRSSSSLRTRATPRGCGASPTRPPTSRMRSTNTSSRAAATRCNPAKVGTKAAARTICSTCRLGGSKTVNLRLAAAGTDDGAAGFKIGNAFAGFEKPFKSRLADADEFYDRIPPKSLTADERLVHRQVLAGMLSRNQFYYFDFEKWLREHKSHPLLDSSQLGYSEHRVVRHAQCRRDLDAGQMTIPVRRLGPGVRHHPPVAGRLRFRQGAAPADAAQPRCPSNGQIPAYEWNFGDVNPPVHAWATLLLYKMERNLGRRDHRFLEQAFQGLMLNFNWWFNR